MKLKYLLITLLTSALGLSQANAQNSEIVQTLSAQNNQATEITQSVKAQKSSQVPNSSCSSDCKQTEQAKQTEVCHQSVEFAHFNGCMCPRQDDQPYTSTQKLFRYTCTCGCHNHPVNNYSGLNSLRARLAAKLALNPSDSTLLSATWILHLCGKTSGTALGEKVHDGAHGGVNTDSVIALGNDASIGVEDSAQGRKEDSSAIGAPLKNDNSGDGNVQSANSISRDTNFQGGNLSEDGNLKVESEMANSNKDLIGAPIYFFFKIAGTELTDPSQLLNLDAIAALAKEHNLKVRIIGAADSATGTSTINAKLSKARADYIASQLQSKGLSADRLIVTSSGGISTHSPISANRHCKVELLAE